jgi:hypothetical protein
LLTAKDENMAEKNTKNNSNSNSSNNSSNSLLHADGTFSKNLSTPFADIHFKPITPYAVLDLMCCADLLRAIHVFETSNEEMMMVY